jgi:hypothetical protein
MVPSQLASQQMQTVVFQLSEVYLLLRSPVFQISPTIMLGCVVLEDIPWVSGLECSLYESASVGVWT